MHREPTTFSAESYFETQPPPITLQHDVERVREFVERQQKEGRNVVLVTVGNIYASSVKHAAAPPTFFFQEWWYDSTA